MPSGRLESGELVVMRRLRSSACSSILVIVLGAAPACGHTSSPSTDLRIVDFSFGDGMPSAVVLNDGQPVEVVLRAPAPSSFTTPRATNADVLTPTLSASTPQRKPGYDTVALTLRTVKPGTCAIIADWVDADHVRHPQQFNLTVTVRP